MCKPIALKGQRQARFATLAIAATVGLISAAAARPLEVAMVKSSNSAAVEAMDYVTAGQVIRLGRHETIELSYMHSCIKETITGGTVIVGTDRSEVRAGQITSVAEPCDPGALVLSSGRVTAGGRVYRGIPDPR